MFINWKNITKAYDSFTLDINLSVKKGELVSLLGPSGCGKTTALRTAAGFIMPDGGSFYIDGQDKTRIKSSERNIGMVFQNYALFPHMNVAENIAYGLKIRKTPKKVIKDEVERLLELIHLKGYGQRRITNLSGGEKQRVALARALAIKPDLLLLDEPLSALDAELRKKLRREIRNIQQDLGITTVYVTHDQEEALAVSDRIAVMKDGRVMQYDTPEEIYKNPANLFTAGFIGESNLLPHKEGVLFFRPEDMIIDEIPGFFQFKGKVVETEYAGMYTKGILETDEKMKIKIVSPEIKQNQTIVCSVAKEKTKVFR